MAWKEKEIKKRNRKEKVTACGRSRASLPYHSHLSMWKQQAGEQYKPWGDAQSATTHTTRIWPPINFKPFQTRSSLSVFLSFSLSHSLSLSLSPCFPWNPRRRNRARNIIPFQCFDRTELLGVIITLLLSPSFDRTVKRTYYTFVIRSIVCPTFSVRLYRYTAIDAAFRVKKKKTRVR